VTEQSICPVSSHRAHPGSLNGVGRPLESSRTVGLESDWQPECCNYPLRRDALQRHHADCFVMSWSWDNLVGMHFTTCTENSKWTSEYIWIVRQVSKENHGRVLCGTGCHHLRRVWWDSHALATGLQSLSQHSFFRCFLIVGVALLRLAKATSQLPEILKGEFIHARKCLFRQFPSNTTQKVQKIYETINMIY
jgi:hypothetical protein